MADLRGAGVDFIAVDEAHYVKNLFYVSKMTRIAGLPQTASQRAFDMFLKVQHVQRVNGVAASYSHRHAHQHSVAEMFTMQRFLQMQTLKAHNLAHFDAWAATFGEPVTALELAPDGSGYTLRSRFSRFVNVPELMQMFRQVADIQTQEMLKLPVPDLRGGKPTVIQCAVFAGVEADRAIAGRAGRDAAHRPGGPTRGQHAPGHHRRSKSRPRSAAARSASARSSRQQGQPRGGPDRAHLRETTAERSAQLVFCDLSVPTGGQGSRSMRPEGQAAGPGRARRRHGLCPGRRVGCRQAAVVS